MAQVVGLHRTLRSMTDDKWSVEAATTHQVVCAVDMTDAEGKLLAAVLSENKVVQAVQIIDGQLRFGAAEALGKALVSVDER